MIDFGGEGHWTLSEERTRACVLMLSMPNTHLYLSGRSARPCSLPEINSNSTYTRYGTILEVKTRISLWVLRLWQIHSQQLDCLETTNDLKLEKFANSSLQRTLDIIDIALNKGTKTHINKDAKLTGTGSALATDSTGDVWMQISLDEALADNHTLSLQPIFSVHLNKTGHKKKRV